MDDVSGSQLNRSACGRRVLCSAPAACGTMPLVITVTRWHGDNGDTGLIGSGPETVEASTNINLSYGTIEVSATQRWKDWAPCTQWRRSHAWRTGGWGGEAQASNRIKQNAQTATDCHRLLSGLLPAPLYADSNGAEATGTGRVFGRRGSNRLG
jgi:hypothetical protein